MKSEIPPIKLALFTGGIDKHYASGLWQTLAGLGVSVDVICNSEMKADETEVQQNLRFLTIYANLQVRQSRITKLLAFVQVYVRLMIYAATTSAEVFHVLWNYRIPVFDRTLLLLYYKLLGKRVVFTAHNINAAERDGADSFINRFTLRFQYRNVDHIFVHTELMKQQLVEIFGVRERNVSIIPFGTYDMVPQTSLTPAEAKVRLGLKQADKAILFFGRIAPYKGIDLLVDAFLRIAGKDASYRLVIAGEPMKDAEEQWRGVRAAIEQSAAKKQVLQHTKFIGDDEIELYFKAADVLVLPYTHIFQSGVLFMSYSFGLPVIGTEVGSFAHDIIEGETGWLCRPSDPEDLARAIAIYFSSDLFRTLDERRGKIKEFIQASHSWEKAGRKTVEVYGHLTRPKEFEYST
jgi:D-inositol-3-phosphate glycosyltransferase